MDTTGSGTVIEIVTSDVVDDIHFVANSGAGVGAVIKTGSE